MTYSLRTDVSARELTTLRAGGTCARVIDADNEADLIAALSDFPDALCLGGGSNLVISDAGYSGTIIRATTGTGINFGDTVRADANVDWDTLVAASVERGLQGLESTSGIPGTLGGAIVQNAGAYGQEISDVVVSVRAWDREAKAVVDFSADECGFAYRVSRFKHDTTRRYVILSAELRFEPVTESRARYGDVSQLLEERSGHAGPYPLADIRRAVLEVRAGKGMLLGASEPSAGSFFTNPLLNHGQANELEAAGLPVLARTDGSKTVSASRLLEACGFHRGFVKGNAGLSEFHVLALVNKGDATTEELLALAREMREKVFERFGITLTPEPVMLGFAVYPFASLV